MNLYELTSEYEGLMNMLYDGETDEQTIMDTLESLEYEIEDKADNYAKIIKNIEADTKALKDEEARLYSKRKALDNNIKRLKDNLYNSMKLIGREKFKTLLFSFNIQKNPASLKIEDMAKVPSNYFIPQDPVIDKARLKDDVKGGTIIDGVYLEQGESLRIR